VDLLWNNSLYNDYVERRIRNKSNQWSSGVNVLDEIEREAPTRFISETGRTNSERDGRRKSRDNSRQHPRMTSSFVQHHSDELCRHTHTHTHTMQGYKRAVVWTCRPAALSHPNPDPPFDLLISGSMHA